MFKKQERRASSQELRLGVEEHTTANHSYMGKLRTLTPLLSCPDLKAGVSFEDLIQKPQNKRGW